MNGETVNNSSSSFIVVKKSSATFTMGFIIDFCLSPPIQSSAIFTMEIIDYDQSLTGIVWQGFFLGAMRVAFCASSLASGVLISVLLRSNLSFVSERSFRRRKVSLSFSLYGDLFLTSYDEYKSGKQVLDKPQPPETELPPLPVSVSVVAVSDGHYGPSELLKNRSVRGA
ncbi:hypothetical protein YC2023_083362 [Brassica napus]